MDLVLRAKSEKSMVNAAVEFCLYALGGAGELKDALKADETLLRSLENRQRAIVLIGQP